MRIDLPSGAWVEVRDPETFKGSDRKKVRKSIRLSVTRDGVQEMTGDIDDVMRDALLTQIITSWSLAEQGIPLPSVPRPVAGTAGSAVDPDVIADNLSSRDYAALQDAAQPLLDEVLGRSGPNPPSVNGQSSPS